MAFVHLLVERKVAGMNKTAVILVIVNITWLIFAICLLRGKEGGKDAD